MKRIAFLLALVLCFSCFVGVIASAEDEIDVPEIEAPETEEPEVIEPCRDVVAYTVPIEAGRVSILFAIAVKGLPDDGAYLHLQVKKGDGEFKYYSNKNISRGHKYINGEKCIIFEYSDLTAAEMDVEITVRGITGAGTENEALGAEFTTSVAQFAEDYKTNGGQYTALVDAMLAYGEAVKAFQTAQ